MIRVIFEKLFGIRPQEFWKAQGFFAVSTGIGMFWTVGATVGDTLFLSRLPEEDVPRLLPWVYVGVAVATVWATWLFDVAQSRLPRLPLIVGTQAALAVGTVAAWLWLPLDGLAPLFGLIIWLEHAALLSISLFYCLAGDYVLARDARRLYAYMAGGLVIGAVVAGAGVGAVAKAIETRHLLIVCAAILAVDAAVCLAIGRLATPADDGEGDGDSHRTLAPLRVVLAHPYIRTISVMAIAGQVLFVVVDYQMKWIASGLGEQELARFFGVFYAVVAATQIPLQFFLVHRILQRFGVLRSQLVMPVVVGLGSLAFFFTGSAGLAQALRVKGSAAINYGRMVLAYSINEPVKEMLLLPLPRRLRLRAQAVSGALGPMGQGVGGLVLLACVPLAITVEQLSAIAVIFSGVVVWACLRLPAQYHEVLTAALAGGELQPTDLDELLSQRSSQAALARLLATDDPDSQLISLELLRGRDVGRLRGRIETLAARGTGPVSSAAFDVLCAVPDPSLHEIVDEAIASGDSVVRDAGLAALFRIGAPEGRERARDEVLSRLRGPDPELARGAVQAAASMHDPEIVRVLLDRLDDGALRGAVLRSLSAQPAESAAPLFERLVDSAQDLDARRAIVGAVAKIAGPEAFAAIARCCEPDNPMLLRALAMSSLVDRRREDGIEDPPLERAAQLEKLSMQHIGLLRRAYLAADPQRAVARRALRDHARLHMEVLLSLLALRSNPVDVERVRRNLFSEKAAARSGALDLLESVGGSGGARIVKAVGAWLEEGRSVRTGRRTSELPSIPTQIDPFSQVAMCWAADRAPGHSLTSMPGMKHLYDQHETLAALRHARLLDDVPIHELARIAPHVQTVDVAMMEVLVRQGDASDSLFLVDSGSLIVEVDGVAVATLGADECVGEVGMLDGRPRTATVLAAKPTRTLRIDADAFARLLGGDGRVALTLARVIEGRLRASFKKSATGDAQSHVSSDAADDVVADADSSGLGMVVARVAALRRASLFAGLSTEALTSLASIAAEREIFEGEVLFRRGDDGRALYVIRSGRLDVKAGDRVISRLGPGACAGEMALVGGHDHVATAVAVERVRLLRLPDDRFRNLLTSRADIAQALLRSLARRLRANAERQGGSAVKTLAG